ncbi:hypothetical protein AYO38_06650 [bacterium SCGC AG-212-C10]|nr:hypothetical protein AYO38_06650 [bacterium SCGC AG-212-C10]
MSFERAPAPVGPWTARDIDTNGVTLRVLEAGSGFPVVLLHGYPELAYSWRHQIPALAEAGYHVIVPDQRGYGGSSRPEEIEAYDLDTLAADVAGLLDALGEAKAVVIGHDWGAPVAWHFALTAPERTHAVGSLSVPHAARASRPPLDAMRDASGPEHIFYVDYFQQPGLVDAEFAADPRASLLGFMWSISGDAPKDERFRPIRKGARFLDSITVPATLPEWLTEADLQVCVDNFTASSFTGGINWYRNTNRNWERSERFANATIPQPALFVTGSRDPARGPAAIAKLPEVVTDLRVNELLMGCGHWTQQERPEEVNKHLLRFLREVCP